MKRRPAAARAEVGGGRPPRRRAASPRNRRLEAGGASLLDLVDNTLNRGVSLEGEVVLGLAGVDLVYLRLSALLGAFDRVQARRSARSSPRPAGPRPTRRQSP